MNIYVLIKRTFDTEEKIVIRDGQIQEDDAEFIINPYDEYAIEEAIRQREQHGGKVTVVTLGKSVAEKQLRTALAVGADRAVLIELADDCQSLDRYKISEVLATYLKSQQPDLILVGNVAIDGGSGQIGPRIADILAINYVTTITGLKIQGKKVKITRDVEGDIEELETSLPLLITAQQGLNEPRYPSLPGILKARKNPIEELKIDDLNIELEDIETKIEVVDVFLPSKKNGGHILEGNLQTRVTTLVQLLHSEAKVI